MLEILFKNSGAILQLLVMLATFLIAFDRLSERVKKLVTDISAKASALQVDVLSRDLERLMDQFKIHLEKYSAHENDVTPHRSCLVETAKMTSLAEQLAKFREDHREDMKRLEQRITEVATLLRSDGGKHA